MQNPQVQISHHFQWDTPWKFELLVGVAVILIVWTIWQLIREGMAAQLHWWVLFILTRTAVAAVLLWMILGPTSVLTRTETNPRTLSVYIDNSSSMQIQDTPDPIADRRWELAADYQVHPLAVADRVVFFASALRQQTARLSDAVEQQGDREERQQIAAKWQELAAKCREWLDSDILHQSLIGSQQLHRELQSMLKHDLQPLMDDTTWITGTDSGIRDQRLQQLTEIGDQFLSRCRILADEFATAYQSANPAKSVSSAVEVPTRLQLALPAIRQGLTEWQKQGKVNFRIRMAQFSQEVTPLPVDNWETGLVHQDESGMDGTPVRRTDLSKLLKQIRDDAGKEEIAAAVIITDGRQTVEDADDPRAIVSQLRLPLFLVPVGHGEMKRDVILRHIHAPNSVIQKDKILIEGIVTGHATAGESCEVRLMENQRVIESRQVTFKSEQDDQRFRFEVATSATGRREFKVEVEKLAEEYSADNNTQSVAVNVTDSMLRIMVADGRARWEYQYLVNLFDRQDTVELDQLKFTPVAVGTGRLKKRPRFPETVQEWAEYRVVILGDVSPKQLSQESQESLRDYVTQRGGSLIVIAGQNEMPHSFKGQPLEKLLPVENVASFSPDKGGYRVDMTAEGKTSDFLLLGDDLISTEQVWRETGASLPMYFFSTYHKPKPNSQVLLRAVPSHETRSSEDPLAFLCWQTVGAGRVAYFSSPSTYQLRNRNGDKYHHRFWGQLIRWIVTRSAPTGSKTVKLVADKSHYYRGDQVQVTVELSDLDGRPVTQAAPQVDVVRRGEVVSNINFSADPKNPGRYLGTFAANDDGRVSLRARGSDVERLLKEEKYFEPIEVQVDIEPGLDRELADPRADRPLLEHLAEHTGGVVLEPTAFAELRHAASLQPRVLESSQKTTLWDRWWCLWVILGCLTLEWVIRKRIGLA